MKDSLLIFFCCSIALLYSCNEENPLTTSDEATWKLAWRMTESSMEENYELAELQFDSLLSISSDINDKFLSSGLEIKSRFHKTDDINKILKNLNSDTKRKLCQKDFLNGEPACQGLSKEIVSDKSLQLKLISMYIDDQASRGNMMHDLIDKFKIDTSTILPDYGISTDLKNRNKLKEIIKTHGFPTKEMVGKDAMHGIFLIIQHADGDTEWQKSQLANIEIAVKKGDMDGQSYAYLFDRIKVNSDENQRYGSQFSFVDPENNIVDLAPVEDIEELDARRRSMGMMPIAMYKKFMLRYSKK